MFIGILGHDLRNPLNAIGMAAGLLIRRGHLNAQDAEATTLIISSGQRMARMITQVLDLTRARLGGGLPIDPKPTDLGDICRNVVEEFDATIELEVLGDVKGTWDQDRLTEVLSNLVGERHRARRAANGRGRQGTRRRNECRRRDPEPGRAHPRGHPPVHLRALPSGEAAGEV